VFSFTRQRSEQSRKSKYLTDCTRSGSWGQTDSVKCARKRKRGTLRISQKNCGRKLRKRRYSMNGRRLSLRKQKHLRNTSWLGHTIAIYSHLTNANKSTQCAPHSLHNSSEPTAHPPMSIPTPQGPTTAIHSKLSQRSIRKSLQLNKESIWIQRWDD
jgi:hypothetical protein